MLISVCTRTAPNLPLGGIEQPEMWEHTMIEIFKTLMALKSARRAVTALEYGLIAGVIVATVAVGFGVLAGDLSTKFNNIGGSL